VRTLPATTNLRLCACTVQLSMPPCPLLRAVRPACIGLYRPWPENQRGTKAQLGWVWA
jgi:hypothetical protein